MPLDDIFPAIFAARENCFGERQKREKNHRREREAH